MFNSNTIVAWNKKKYLQKGDKIASLACFLGLKNPPSKFQILIRKIHLLPKIFKKIIHQNKMMKMFFFFCPFYQLWFDSLRICKIENKLIIIKNKVFAWTKCNNNF